VEVVGASTRVPAVYKLVQDTFGMTPSRTLNAKEVVSRGCALSCAMLSPVFKVGWVRLLHDRGWGWRGRGFVCVSECWRGTCGWAPSRCVRGAPGGRPFGGVCM
jgi:hypothetical protein